MPDPGYSGFVTIALAGGSGGTLTGATTVQAIGGVATFNDLILGGLGKYQLIATGTKLNASAPTSAINVVLPAEVTNVLVDGTSWSSGYYGALASAGQGNGQGYSIPVGSSAQMATLPWGNLNQIQIQFSENVNVQENSLALTGINVANYPFAGFSYANLTHTAVWTLASPIGADRLSLDLKSTGLAGVTDTSGYPLDGEWTNGASAFPSGGSAGVGDFKFALNVLPGDANQDGIVNGQDLVVVASHWMQTGSRPGDFMGSGVVNVQDISVIASNWLAMLPSGGAGGSASGVEATTLTVGSSSASPAIAGLAAPASSSIGPMVDRTAAFIGRPHLAAIDHVLADEAATHGNALGKLAIFPTAMPVETRNVPTAGELPTSIVDEVLLSTLAAARKY
jgi:hypothetical protein